VLGYFFENRYLRIFPIQMRSLFQLISRFFQRLFNGGDSPSENRLEKSPQRFSSPSSESPSGRADRLLADESESASLRRLIYQATYRLPQKQRTHAAQVGALLRQEDRTFSYEKYKVTKLIDLLESVPDLVAMEKVAPHPDNPNSAPVYYVRPVIDIRQLLTRALMSHDSAEGWMHLESVREAVSEQDPSFSTQRYGFNDFTAFVQSRADLIEFKVDSPGYVRLIQFRLIQSQAPGRAIAKPAKRLLKKSTLNPHTVDPNGYSQSDTNGHRNSASTRSATITIEPLSKFANLPMETLHQKVSELAAIALPENWYFGSQPPTEFAYPILKSYLRYSFIRLQHEAKVIASRDQQHRAFNTGLLDTLLRPIYGLLSGPSSGLSERQWNLAFCIAGEGFAGKKLVAQFAELPVAANYFANADQAFYHLAAGTPQVDWQHVVKDNMARLPLAFLARYAPAGFTPRSTQGLTTPEFFDYKRAFVAALDADPAGYRTLVRKLEEALERTLKRIQINYKTAVPTYYPKLNSIDLLLPMCLVDENTVDLALVVRREPSGQYIGHTVLTMRQAYNNARLICKLDEHWLTRSLALSQEDFSEEEEDDEGDVFTTDKAASFEENKVATQKAL
jgi:hypothetical protein